MRAPSRSRCSAPSSSFRSCSRHSLRPPRSFSTPSASWGRGPHRAHRSDRRPSRGDDQAEHATKTRGRSHARRVCARLRTGSSAHARRATVAADSVPRRGADPRELRRDRVQRHRPQLSVGRDTRSPARAPERDEKVHRVGCDPARLAHGRRARFTRRPSADAVGRRNRRILELPAPPAFARPLDRQHGRRRAPTCTCADRSA